MSRILEVIYLMLPLILAGTTNMIFIKTPYFNFLKRPIDLNIILSDGQRLFGNNKSWKFFIGMIVFTSFWFFLFYILAITFPWAARLSLIPFYKFHSIFSIFIFGAVWGFSYVLFELPNSFFKRRLRIAPGEHGKGALGLLFIFIDQADSVIGCSLAMLIFYIPGMTIFLLFIIIGIIVHFLMNILLFIIGVRKKIV